MGGGPGICPAGAGSPAAEGDRDHAVRGAGIVEEKWVQVRYCEYSPINELIVRRSVPIWVTTLFVAIACSAPAQSGGLDPRPALEAILISPASVSLVVGDSIGFEVIGQYSDGSTADVGVSWASTGGTVSAGGVYRAGGAPGTYLLIAVTPDFQHADTAVVTVTARGGPPALTGLSLQPASATLDPGAAVSFNATARYSDGSSNPIAATWSATGGTVGTTGTYQAGNTPGSYRVIGIAQGVSDTAQVTIRDTTTPPPPPPPASTILLTEGFDDAQVGLRGWYDNTSPAISTSEQRSGAGALQMAFGAGATSPDKGGAMRHKFSPTDRVFLRYWVKYSANFVGSGTTYHPHELHFLTDVDTDWIGPSATHLTLYVEHTWQAGGGIPRLNISDALNIDATQVGQDLSASTEKRGVAGCNGNTDGYPTSCYQSGGQWRNGKQWDASAPSFTNAAGTGYKNDWHMVEVYYQLNSIQGGKGVADGIAQYWFDGQLRIDLHNVLFRTGANASMRLTQFLIAPYIGVGSPVAQTLWVDDLTLATGRVP